MQISFNLSQNILNQSIIFQSEIWKLDWNCKISQTVDFIRSHLSWMHLCAVEYLFITFWRFCCCAHIKSAKRWWRDVQQHKGAFIINGFLRNPHFSGTHNEVKFFLKSNRVWGKFLILMIGFNSNWSQSSKWEIFLKLDLISERISPHCGYH